MHSRLLGICATTLAAITIGGTEHDDLRTPARTLRSVRNGGSRKPFSESRFDHAVQRANQLLDRRHVGELAKQLQQLRAVIAPDTRFLERVVVRNGSRIYFVPTADIAWISAADNYAKIHVGKRSHLVRESLGSLHAKLDPGIFLRSGTLRSSMRDLWPSCGHGMEESSC